MIVESPILPHLTSREIYQLCGKTRQLHLILGGAALALQSEKCCVETGLAPFRGHPRNTFEQEREGTALQASKK
jgi:hypothetical protein